MKTTDLFRESMKPNSEITWKDIFSKSFVKHSQLDVERTLQIGTLSRRVPADQMLQTWHRPWLWWKVAKYGLGLVALLYLVFFFCIIALGSVASSICDMMMIIPPIIIPAIIMVFLWELNVPQDISFLSMWAYFLIGGIISFLITTVLFLPFESDLPASYAAFREEPAKLIACIAILHYLQSVKKQKIYGFTGLVVGAAVGAAFSAIESVSYAISYSGDFMTMIDVQITRGLYALGGHIVYCVPYATAIALNCERRKITAKSYLNIMTIGSFLFAVATHWVWNSGWGTLVNIAIVIMDTFILLYWIKLCFKDIVKVPQRPAGDIVQGRPARACAITVYCKNAGLAGMKWHSVGNPLVIGRQKERCAICYPDSTKGVSREHCRLVLKDGVWYLQDLQSSCGTFVDGKRLNALELHPVRSGSNIYLGSDQVWLQIL